MDHITILSFIYIVIVVAALFGLCILIHELGHFISAKMLGMVIDTFSIGFGPAIWKRKYGNVLFKICAFPIGGYVALPQMDPSVSNNNLPAKENKKNTESPGGPAACYSAKSAEAASATKHEPRTGDVKDKTVATACPAKRSGEEAERDGHPVACLPPVTPWKKIVVAVAGAAGNMLLAYIVAWIVYIAGKPSTPAERCAILGFVETNSTAYSAGLKTGDEILAINGRAVQNWQDIIQENALSEKVSISLKTTEGTKSVTLSTECNALGFRTIPGIHEITLCKVLSAEPGSSAAAAGIQSGDLIKKFDGIDVLSIDHLIALTSARAGQTVPMAVERNGKELIMNVTPQFDASLNRARIGIRFDPMAVDFDRVVHIAPAVQIKSHSLVIFRVLRSLVTPKEAKATSQSLGGPLMIIYMLQDMVRKGLVIALWFVCLLNVNLAILNLLPLPVLDGGHVIFALWQIVFRRPVPPKAVLFLDQLFFGLLILAIVLITGRDIKRLYQIRQLSKPPAGQQTITNQAVPPDVEPNDDE